MRKVTNMYSRNDSLETIHHIPGYVNGAKANANDSIDDVHFIISDVEMPRSKKLLAYPSNRTQCNLYHQNMHHNKRQSVFFAKKQCKNLEPENLESTVTLVPQSFQSNANNSPRLQRHSRLHHHNHQYNYYHNHLRLKKNHNYIDKDNNQQELEIYSNASDKYNRFLNKNNYESLINNNNHNNNNKNTNKTNSYIPEVTNTYQLNLYGNTCKVNNKNILQEIQKQQLEYTSNEPLKQYPGYDQHYNHYYSYHYRNRNSNRAKSPVKVDKQQILKYNRKIPLSPSKMPLLSKVGVNIFHKFVPAENETTSNSSNMRGTNTSVLKEKHTNDNNYKNNNIEQIHSPNRLYHSRNGNTNGGAGDFTDSTSNSLNKSIENQDAINSFNDNRQYLSSHYNKTILETYSDSDTPDERLSSNTGASVSPDNGITKKIIVSDSLKRKMKKITSRLNKLSHSTEEQKEHEKKLTQSSVASGTRMRRVLLYSNQSPIIRHSPLQHRVQRMRKHMRSNENVTKYVINKNLSSSTTTNDIMSTNSSIPAAIPCTHVTRNVLPGHVKILKSMSPVKDLMKDDTDVRVNSFTHRLNYDNNYSSDDYDDKDNDNIDDFSDDSDFSNTSTDSEEGYRSYAYKLTHSLDYIPSVESFLAFQRCEPNMANPNNVLVPSLFPNVPPYVAFSTNLKKGPDVPSDLYRILKWRVSTVMPKVVRNILTNSGMRMLKKTNDWMGVWGRHMKSPCFKSIRPYQKINHLPGSFRIGRKDSCWKNLVKLSSKYGKTDFGFMPKTFIMPNELKQLRRAWLHYSENNIKWIIKPPASARGTGIRVVDSWAQIPKRKPLIVQKYIEKPLLINGSKFDLRLYVLVTSINPLRVYMYHNGLARFASVKYSEKSDTLNDRCMHLTNYSINKLSSNYSKNEDVNACHGHKWTIKSLWNYLSSRGIRIECLWEALRNLVLRTILAGENAINNMIKANMESKYSCFELFGFDVLLDADLVPWLLEVNISPSLHSELPLDSHVKAPLVQSVLNTALYNVPPKISMERQLELSVEMSLPKGPICYDKRLYINNLSRNERMKHSTFTRKSMEDRDEYVDAILDDLTPDDIRCLIISEDELERSKPLERIFPTKETHKYLKYTESPRYYNRLLDAWECRYNGDKRQDGIELLRHFCSNQYHLQVPTSSNKKDSSDDMENGSTSGDSAPSFSEN